VGWPEFAQFVLSGLTTGCVYALVALGFVLCANVSRVVNFAQGEFVMIGGLVAASLLGIGTGLPLALACATLAGALLALLQERLTVKPARKSPDFIQITITLAVAAVIRGAALLIWGKDPLSMPGFSGDGTFQLFGAVLPLQDVWVWGITAVLLGLVFWVLNCTGYGRAIRACSVNERAARLMGIDTERTTAIVFLLAGALGALGGAAVAPIALASWSAGIAFGLKGFIGAAIGGFRNPVFAVAGGLSLGIFESLSSGYISSAAKDTLSYSVLLVYLLVRGGVFARGRRSLRMAEHQ
jgi:branched-subunit amino acid ABC-type transport system permease component